MNLGDIARKRLHFLTFFLAALALFAAPQAANAAVVAATDGEISAEAVEAASGYTPLGSDMIKGQPTAGAYGFQDQFSPNGEYALFMHDAILMPVITAISLLVLALLLWVVARYRKSKNPVPSKTSHNTLIEVLWTVIPVIILLVIAVPSITLISRQFESPPEDALTVKVTGYQWYWGYEYPDNGVDEFVSNMLDEDTAIERGLPPQLAVDNRMVVPVGETIRVQVIGADVIHAFSVPSLWFKIDAVPGRLNEMTMFISEPGIYYGQCSELCGARHGYMPIAVEALPRPQFDAWVLAQGGTVGPSDEDLAEENAPADGDEEVASDADASEPTAESAPAE